MFGLIRVSKVKWIIDQVRILQEMNDHLRKECRRQYLEKMALQKEIDDANVLLDKIKVELQATSPGEVERITGIRTLHEQAYGPSSPLIGTPLCPGNKGGENVA